MRHILFIIITALSLTANAQAPSAVSAEISGTITHKNHAVPFAKVWVKGTQNAAVADEEGNYSLTVYEEGEYSLQVSAIGYISENRRIIIDDSNQNHRRINFDLREDLIGLDEVVVSANRYAEQKKYASIMVNALDSRVADLSQSNSVLGTLDFSPGLRTEDNCQNCGFPQVRMNGMEGPYTQILINSRPIYSGLTGVYGLDIFPSEMIERIEVVRGGGSALYGGNAVAGTINLITKAPSDNHFHIASSIAADNLDADEMSLEKNLDLHASVVSKDRNAGIIVYATKRDKDPTDANGDGFSDRVSVKSQSFGFGSYLKPSQKSKISLDFYALDDYRRGGNKFDKKPHETDITEMADHRIVGSNISYDLYMREYSSVSAYLSGQYTDRDSYYGAEGDETAYGNTEDISAAGGAEYLKRFSFLQSKLLTGFDYKYSRMDDQKLNESGETNAQISYQEADVVGAFFQYDMKTGFLTSSAGLRLDNYSVNDLSLESSAVRGTVLVPRISFLGDIASDFQMRFAYAKGYRSPQIYDEDLHIESSGARRVLHLNSPDLVQETSHSFNSSLRYASVWGAEFPIQAELVLEGFYTLLQDPFANEFSEIDSEGNVQYMRINAESGATVFGANAEINLALPNHLIFQASYTQQKSAFEQSQQWGELPESTSKNFLKSPESYGYMMLTYGDKVGFSASLNTIYTGSMIVQHFGLDPETDVPAELEAIENQWVITGERLETTPEFWNIGFELAYALQVKDDFLVKMTAGMKNIANQQQIFDSSLYRDPGFVYGPSYGRMIVFGLEFSAN